MTLDDYTAVYTLWCSCKGMGLNNLDDSQDGIACFLRRNPDTCFVAEEHGQIVGAILTGNDGRRGHIYHTAVRRNIVGRALRHSWWKRRCRHCRGQG